MASIVVAGDTSGAITIAAPAISGTNTLTLPAATATFDAFPSGTALVFRQTAAPTGWTKSTANDNAALRVVSGAASTGGTVDFTTAFASQSVTGTVGTTGSTTATNNSYTPAGSVSTSTSVGITYLNDQYYMPYHNHAYNDPTVGALIGLSYDGNGNTAEYVSSLGNGTTNAGGNGYHNHSASSSSSFSGTAATITQAAHTHTGGTFTGNAINLAVKYVDTIIATKN